MAKMKRSLVVLSAVALLGGVAYLLVRAGQIRDADRTVDAFFAQFRSADGRSAETYLGDLDQDTVKIKSILKRHGEAIKNYSYQEHSPLMDLTLRTAKVEVSWHLNVVLSKGESGWYISSFDEYAPDKTGA